MKSFVTVDAAGVVVGPAAIYLDDAGVQWPLDPESGAIEGAVTFAFYAAGGCTGPEYVRALAPPDVAFTVGSAGIYRARDRTTQAVPRSLMSQRINGTCGSAASPYSMILSVPSSTLRYPQVPLVAFTGPLHSELR